VRLGRGRGCGGGEQEKANSTPNIPSVFFYLKIVFDYCVEKGK
jgi:hypothetical protein